jgi:hypothetical protein
MVESIFIIHTTSTSNKFKYTWTFIHRTQIFAAVQKYAFLMQYIRRIIKSQYVQFVVECSRIFTFVDAGIACSVVEHSKMHYCVFLGNSISNVRRGQIFDIPQSAHVLSCSHKPIIAAPIAALLQPSLLPSYNPHCCPLTTHIAALFQLSLLPSYNPLLLSNKPHCCPFTTNYCPFITTIAALFLPSSTLLQPFLLPSFNHQGCPLPSLLSSYLIVTSALTNAISVLLLASLLPFYCLHCCTDNL